MKSKSLFVGLVLAMIFTSCQSSKSKSESDITFTLPGGSTSFKMIYVEGGSFNMGCTVEDFGVSDNSVVFKVALSNYYIGEFEVTQELWKAVMGTTVVEQRDKNEFSYDWPLSNEGANYPMYYVNWNECEEFCIRLNNMLEGELPEGYQFMLPTEAQWEYAARGGKKGKSTKSSRRDYIYEFAWLYDDIDEFTHEVGQKGPNELGIYDMSGNVCEWCMDWYNEPSDDSSTTKLQKSKETSRVGRENGLEGSAVGCRVFARGYTSHYYRCYCLGMRLALVQK
ncbi:MAG: SUMF1/EgtB/PvdO family nonheme iron enzyme [bacterium]